MGFLFTFTTLKTLPLPQPTDDHPIEAASRYQSTDPPTSICFPFGGARFVEAFDRPNSIGSLPIVPRVASIHMIRNFPPKRSPSVKGPPCGSRGAGTKRTSAKTWGLGPGPRSGLIGEPRPPLARQVENGVGRHPLLWAE